MGWLGGTPTKVENISMVGWVDYNMSEKLASPLASLMACGLHFTSIQSSGVP